MCFSALIFLYLSSESFKFLSAPHIGHLYTVLLADVCHRWNVLKNESNSSAVSVFSTGADEHGIKVRFYCK